MNFSLKKIKKVNVALSKQFEEDFTAADEINEDNKLLTSGEIDWLTLVPKRKSLLKLEDGFIKSERLKEEGASLAEAERFWEAISKWNEAILLMPNNETLYEMKAQTLINLNEVMPAVLSAKKSVELNPQWWIGHQTFGRALLSMGEVKMALLSFQRSIHLKPDELELWVEDLQWTVEIFKKKTVNERLLKELVEKEVVGKESRLSSSSLVEINDLESEKNNYFRERYSLEKDQKDTTSYLNNLDYFNVETPSEQTERHLEEEEGNRIPLGLKENELPNNYVFMRN